MGKSVYLAALTGSIGSGKSTVAALFEELGACIIDADVLAREAVEKGSAVLEGLAHRFGARILLGDGSLDRKALADIIFTDAKCREDAEALIHPEVRRRFDARLAAAPEGAIVIYSVPLLFESGQDLTRFRAIIVVTAPEPLLVERIMQRDMCSEADARRRLESQLPAELKAQRATHVISNEGSREALRERVQDLYELMRRDAAKSSPCA